MDYIFCLLRQTNFWSATSPPVCFAVTEGRLCIQGPISCPWSFYRYFQKIIWILRNSRKSSMAKYFAKGCYVCLRGWEPSLFGYSRRLFNTLYPTIYIMCASSQTKFYDLPAMVIRKRRTKHNKLNMLGKWRHRIIFGTFIMLLHPEFHFYIRMWNHYSKDLLIR